MNKLTKQEAEKDLEDVTVELNVMHEIRKWAEFLSGRADVSASYYKSVCFVVEGHIASGNNLKDKITEHLKNFPPLHE